MSRLVLAATLLATSCVRSEAGGDPPLEPSEATVETPQPAARVEPASPPPVEPPVRLLISDPETLAALEREHGLSLAALLHDAPTATALADYGPGPLTTIRTALRRRLASDRAELPSRTGVGLRYVHRQFDLDWLSADDTRFELVAVVNRMDRQVFRPGDEARPNFGETRLIYRLAYTREQGGQALDSRLPMTINVVYWQRAGQGPDERTGEQTDKRTDQQTDERASARRVVAARWRTPARPGAALAAWLAGPEGPLAPGRLAREQLDAVEINVQTERWPSTIRPAMAGHAEYLLQVFRDDGEGGWRAQPLENTPDLSRLRRRPAARAELLAWLQADEQRAALDAGTLVVPERFLARAATSVTPKGFARLTNRPWSQLFGPEDFADYDFRGLEIVRSPRGLLRRLDGLSCQGCHQSRSVAGFHLLGEARDPAAVLDTLALPGSPHLDGELERRGAWHAALAAGELASEQRQLSEHERARGAWGSHCGLAEAGAVDPSFADWTCDPGLVCTALGDDELGTCLESGPAQAGGVCEVGTMRTRTDHHRDRVVDLEARPCADGGVCNDNAVGFPEGMCAFSCAASDEDPTRGCGAIPNLHRFNNCLAAGRPFSTCIETTANPAGMRSCSADAPCRDDYICARSSAEAEAGTGVCLPPYFLFQLRVDGHLG